jgi:hypothetical protein
MNNSSTIGSKGLFANPCPKNSDEYTNFANRDCGRGKTRIFAARAQLSNFFHSLGIIKLLQAIMILIVSLRRAYVFGDVSKQRNRI